MIRLVTSEKTTPPLEEVEWVAEAATRQILQTPELANRSISEMFLHDAFALGYAIGFAEQACWHLRKGNGEENCPDYLRKVIGCMLGNEAVAASFVSFAVSKQGERMFEGGYDEGMRDLDAMYLSYGDCQPLGLMRHLTTKPDQG